MLCTTYNINFNRALSWHLWCDYENIFVSCAISKILERIVTTTQCHESNNEEVEASRICVWCNTTL